MNSITNSKASLEIGVMSWSGILFENNKRNVNREVIGNGFSFLFFWKKLNIRCQLEKERK